MTTGAATVNMEIFPDASKLVCNDPIPPRVFGARRRAGFLECAIFHFSESVQIIFHSRHHLHSARLRPPPRGLCMSSASHHRWGWGMVRGWVGGWGGCPRSARSTTQAQCHSSDSMLRASFSPPGCEEIKVVHRLSQQLPHTYSCPHPPTPTLF